MGSKIIINAVDPDICRLAKIKGNKLEELHTETTAKESIKGNIYKGIITRVEPSLQAVFVDYGANRQGFLEKDQIHSDYFIDSDSGDQSIYNLLKEGQELLVQVIKDPLMKKGAMLTTFLTFPGRYVVLMLGSKNKGISRKIENEDERNRIKETISNIKLPEGFGLIIRTAGLNCARLKLKHDINHLLRLWENIKNKGMNLNAPALIHKERNLAVRSIRDYLTDDVNEIAIDNENIYNEVKDFLHIISPKHAKIVTLYNEPMPILAKYKIEDQIESIFEKKVFLKSGGTLVIEQTEALVAIDVNSGKAKNDSLEKTAFNTNLEASEEIARQLKLRDLGGLIVIDFIDMREQKNRTRIEKALKSHLKKDKAKVSLSRISKFGLLEVSRQRTRPSLESSNFELCQTCKGKGTVLSCDTIGRSFLRKLNGAILDENVSIVRGSVPPNIGNYLLNIKRKELFELENKYNTKIIIEIDPNMQAGEGKIISEKKSED
ncbi:MAG: Rne/Rng family ribonuclease [Desulfobacterales bacterium]|nr:Rne/Rng family ribonuclease [Desulfobacterales bacterium]